MQQMFHKVIANFVFLHFLLRPPQSHNNRSNGRHINFIFQHRPTSFAIGCHIHIFTFTIGISVCFNWRLSSLNLHTSKLKLHDCNMWGMEKISIITISTAWKNFTIMASQNGVNSNMYVDPYLIYCFVQSTTSFIHFLSLMVRFNHF